MTAGPLGLAVGVGLESTLPVRYVETDLFASGVPAIGHGCNCAGAMGKGIAVEFRRRWPDMYEQYQRRCRTGEFSLGDVFVYEADDRTVFNLGTQRTWRSRADLSAIDSAVGAATVWAEEHGLDAIALPRIGAGLGGLAWDDVSRVLDSVAGRTSVDLVICDLPRAATPSQAP